ncbi:MAG: PilZ domain-containing protein [Phycisphaerales bacterium]|nr:PilZ domain-containing protein [Phycisphaerales bacterium]
MMHGRDDALDALRISDAEAQAVLRELDSVQPALPGGDGRRHRRYAYYVPGGVGLQIQGVSQTYLVRPRNISRGGIAFLHGLYLYKGTPCTLVLKTRGGERLLARGVVQQCRCVRGRIHEVRVRFVEEVDVELFVDTFAQAGDAESGPGYDGGQMLDVLDKLRDAVEDGASLDEVRKSVARLARMVAPRAPAQP